MIAACHCCLPPWTKKVCSLLSFSNCGYINNLTLPLCLLPLPLQPPLLPVFLLPPFLPTNASTIVADLLNLKGMFFPFIFNVGHIDKLTPLLAVSMVSVELLLVEEEIPHGRGAHASQKTVHVSLPYLRLPR